MTETDFEEFLRQGNMAKNTISAYCYAVREFNKRHKELTKKNLLVYNTPPILDTHIWSNK